MKTSTVNLVKLEPSEGMHLRNKNTGEVFDGFIYLAKSLDVSDFEEITQEKYREIITEREKERESENGEERYRKNNRVSRKSAG